MKAIKNSLYFVLGTVVLFAMTSCEPRALTEADVFTQESDLEEALKAENPDGYTIYTLNDFLDTFMKEDGNFLSDTTQYRGNATTSGKFYVFSLDTIPTNGKGVYIRGRVTTDDFSGNFYKSLVIQQIVNGEQQNLRISLDMGSSGGMYQLGQEVLIRCNGLAIGRYSNQPQLCIPTYNNKIFAMSAAKKVGWEPGRIPSADFRRATRMIGAPDQSKLQYDTLTLTELYKQIAFKVTCTAKNMDKVRKMDGRLVVIKDVWFTGEYDDNGTIKKCDTQHPDSSGGANVFAPTTQNIGYPQSRLLSDGKNKIMCSSSEYAKFAYFYLPGADKNGITNCKNWIGTITGILGWYQDKADNLSKPDGYEWSVTPRGIPGIGIADIYMSYKEKPDSVWVPKEFDPNDR